MLTLRRVLSLLLVVAAAIVAFAVSPQSKEITDAASGDAGRSEVNSNFNSNDARATTIYQQQYAAGIAAKDSLLLLSQQQDDLAQLQVAVARATAKGGPDRRIPLELLILVALVAVYACTTPARGETALGATATPGPTPVGQAPAALTSYGEDPTPPGSSEAGGQPTF